jgi:hypothetical protein
MYDDQPAEFIKSGFPAVTARTGIKLADAADRHARSMIRGTQRSSAILGTNEKGPAALAGLRVDQRFFGFFAFGFLGFADPSV